MLATISGPPDATIELEIVEADGSTSTMVLWDTQAGISHATHLVANPESLRSGETVLGVLHVDDRLSFDVDGELVESAEFSEMLAAGIVSLISDALERRVTQKRS